MIIQNAIKITENYPDEFFLVSSNRHDYRTYTFKNGDTVMVDGGTDYIRRGGSVFDKLKGYGTDWMEWSIDDKIPFDTIKAMLLWGTRGKDGKQPLKYVLLCECDTEHLKAILTYKGYRKGSELSPLYKKVIKAIIKDQKTKPF